MDAEKEIIRVKAHEKQISTITHNRGPSGTMSWAVDQDGIPTGKPASDV